MKHDRHCGAQFLGAPGLAWTGALALLGLLILSLVTGCRTMEPLPPVDLSAPGWHLRQGQAVWKPPGGRPELAGTLMLATNDVGSLLVQFSKTPFELALARQSGDRWQLALGGGEHVWQGRGEPPSRFPWFEVPRAFQQLPLRGDWLFSRAESHWRLENPRTGEWLEGVLLP